MTLFWALAAALTAAALAFLLPPLLRRRTAAPDDRVAANAAIYREQLEELAGELQRGAIDQGEFERASREIERRIVAEHADGGPETVRPRPLLAAAIAIGLGLPMLAGLGYWHLGEPRGLTAEALRADDPKQLAALVERLAAHLQKTPDDSDGWALLGRALASMGHYERAAKSLARAVQLAPDNRELLVEFIKTLALAGRAEFEQRNFAAAIGYWERILPFAPPESEFARTVASSIAEAKQLSGGAAAPAAASLQGVVSLDPAMKGKVAPGDTVFILARPAAGSRMPLAVARVTVAQLPYRFTLDDSMAMAPGATISSHAQITVVARVSRAGSAAPQKGDIEGSIGPVAPGATGLKVIVSRVLD